MKGYVLAIREKMNDPAAFNRYEEAAMPTLNGREMLFLSAYGRIRTLEGQKALGAVIIEFPSFDAAEDWYDSPAYEKARSLRADAADYRFILVEGLQ